MSDYNDGILPTPCLRMDTHFGDEYESIEFGDGTGYIKATPILAKVGALHEEIDRLQDENAENEQLRRERDFYFQQVTDNGERAHRAIDALNAENAELRELVRDMAAVICVYDQCVTVDDCPPALPMFTDKMRELGIEVDA